MRQLMPSARKGALVHPFHIWFIDPLSPAFGTTSAAAFGVWSLIDPARLRAY